jgi:hypothetical protein
MKTIDVLKTRLEGDLLFVQNENGFTGKMGFEWNDPATDTEIEKFEIENNVVLPDGFKDFLRISNGALLFKDTQYSQWGCKVLGLNDLISITEKVASWGYSLDSNWLVFATWLGDTDILLFDMNKYETGNKDYIIDGEQGEQVEDWENIRGDFSKWLDRLIVAQGAKYWRWY